MTGHLGKNIGISSPKNFANTVSDTIQLNKEFNMWWTSTSIKLQ